MIPTSGKIILRFSKSQIEERLKVGRFFIANVMNDPKYASEMAYVESSSNPEYKKGMEIAVSYRIGHDYNQEDPNDKHYRNEWFIEECNDGSELRYCIDSWVSVFGYKKDDAIVPYEGYVFCEVPSFEKEKEGRFIIPDSFKNVNTDSAGYKTKIKYIRKEDSDEYGLFVGDEIWCDPNSDIKKTIFGETLIAVPTKKVCAKIESKKLSTKLTLAT